MKLLKSALAATLLAAGLAVPTSGAAAAAEEGLEITAVKPELWSGGYPSVAWGRGGIIVEFSDATPSDRDVYVATATPVDGGDAVSATYRPYEGWGDYGAMLTVGTAADFPFGASYTVAVEQRRRNGTVVESSTAQEFVVNAIGHPERATIKVKHVQGRKKTVRAGSRVRIAWKGSWESGAKLTQVVYAVGRKGFDHHDFVVCEGSWCPAKKVDRQRWVRPGKTPITGFRVPKRFAGKKLIIVSYGMPKHSARNGQLTAPWGWSWTYRVR